MEGDLKKIGDDLYRGAMTAKVEGLYAKLGSWTGTQRVEITLRKNGNTASLSIRQLGQPTVSIIPFFEETVLIPG
jgi:hypothetical protein